MPLLHDSATAGDGSDSDWRAWLDYFGRPDISCHTGQHFSEAGMLINAAMLARRRTGPVSLVADQIASGALVCPLKLAAPTAYTYYLLGLPEAVDKPKIAMFRKLLVTEAAATEAFRALDRYAGAGHVRQSRGLRRRSIVSPAGDPGADRRHIISTERCMQDAASSRPLSASAFQRRAAPVRPNV